MIFTKEQTVEFLNSIMLDFDGTPGYEMLSQVVKLYIEDSDFVLREIRSLSIFLNSVNRLDPKGEVFDHIFHFLSKKGVIDFAFSELSHVDEFLTLLKKLNLGVYNKESVLQWIVYPRIHMLVGEKEEVLQCINLMVDFLEGTCVEEVVSAFSEEQFYFLWRAFTGSTKILLRSLSEDQIWTLNTWKTTERHHYYRLLQFMNAFLKDDNAPLREPTLDALKQVVLGRIIRAEWSSVQADVCLRMIRQHEKALMLRCVAEECTESAIESTLIPTPPPSELRTTALVDIDLTLMQTTDGANIYNVNLIQALKQTGIQAIYLFSDMACVREILFYREQLIEFLQREGIHVLGVMTPMDLVADIDADLLVSLYERLLAGGRIDVLNDETGALIFNRLAKGQYPFSMGATYRHKLAVQQNLEPKDYEEFDRSAAFPVELLRRLTRLIIDIGMHHRNIFHIKGFLFEQFLKYNTQYDKVYVIDDLKLVLRSVENVFAQTPARQIKLSTIPVKSRAPFESTSVEKYTRRITCDYYMKYSGRGERFLLKFSHLAIKPVQQTSALLRSVEETRDTLYSLAKQYIEATDLARKNEYGLALKVMLDFARAYYQESLGEQIAYVIKKFPEFAEEDNAFMPTYK